MIKRISTASKDLLMRTNVFLLILTIVFLSCTRKSIVQSEPDKRPNIIVLLADDAGYADFGFMGSEDIKTPHLDRLAKNGMIFTDAHVSATVCAPSRAGLLTGRYQQRFGFECNSLTAFAGIDTSIMTIAEALQASGYATGAFGKWHVGDGLEARPNNRGFDYSWGFLAGARSYFPDAKTDKEGHLKSIRENDHFTTFEGYLTDALGDKAVEFIDRHKEEPFFMYWATNAPHTPMHATTEDLARFEGHPRQRLAAMTWAMDRAIGSIVSKLEKESVLNNTLIFFLSDNGGASNNKSSNFPLKGNKGNKFEGGHRIAFLAHWPEVIKGGQTFDGLTSALDIFATSVDVGKSPVDKQELDGVSLYPYFVGQQEGSPHDRLFWRKEGMAAMRNGEDKLIRVDSLGIRLYDLKNDLGEKYDLSESAVGKSEGLQNELKMWETGLIAPLWVESKEWNEVTWWKHYDLFHNQKIRVKSPKDLKLLKGE